MPTSSGPWMLFPLGPRPTTVQFLSFSLPCNTPHLFPFFGNTSDNAQGCSKSLRIEVLHFAATKRLFQKHVPIDKVLSVPLPVPIPFLGISRNTRHNTWFTNRSDEKLNSTTKRKAKSEVAEDADSPTGLGNTKRTKRNVSTGPYDTSSDGDISIDWPSLESNESSLGSSSKVSVPSLSSSSPPLAQSHQDPDAHTQPDSSTHTPGETICTSGLSSAAEEESASIVAVSLIRNPLSSLCATAAPVLRDSPEPTAHVLERRSGSPSNEHTGTVDQGLQVEVPSTSHTGATASTSQPSVRQTAPGPTDVSGKKKSWCPPSNKSGRTLCMHRYQKQVGGSLDEFNSYFEALSPEVKMRYKDEAKDLVARGIWVNGTANVIAKFSSLPMH
ncbi:hypothetical protein EV401DRAFT_2200382 [Pisolithus croceorrhizus]|nr:hypothetical protein EV401DRAFT_2200382 [Pisolithus croceorrhizus]